MSDETSWEHTNDIDDKLEFYVKNVDGYYPWAALVLTTEHGEVRDLRLDRSEVAWLLKVCVDALADWPDS